MVDYENLPEGYIKKRRIRGVMLGVSIYIMIIFLAISMNIYMNSTIWMLLYGSICVASIVLVCMNDSAKIRFNNMPIPNYNEIKVFSLKESLMLILTAVIGFIILIYFYKKLIWYVFPYVLSIGLAYVGVRTFTRPMDAFDLSGARDYGRHR